VTDSTSSLERPAGGVASAGDFQHRGCIACQSLDLGGHLALDLSRASTVLKKLDYTRGNTSLFERNGGFMKITRILGYLILAGFSFALVLPSTAKPKPEPKVDGAEVFKQYCSSCHLGGGNRVKEKRQLAGSKQLSNLPIFKSYLSSPPGHMPYYRAIVKDEKTLQALYDYCKKLPKLPIKSANLDQDFNESL